MKKTRITKKIIAAFMAFIIAFVSAPIQAIALSIEKMEQIEDNVIDAGYEIDKDVFLVEEDLSKRGQFEKHYLCSDGTYISVTYPEAIHYLDDNNNWQDVDQTLTYDSASGMYISDKADFEVSFSNKASADNMARIERDGYTLSWGIQTTKKNENVLARSAIQTNSAVTTNTDIVLIPSSSVSAIIENPIDNKNTDIKDRLVANNDTFALPKISSQISYSNIFDGTQNVSLKYTVYHNKIEEDIIISERGDLQSVSMNMDVGILSPIINVDGSVDLVDTNNEMQFHIGIPYMVDADYKVCNDIQVTAEKNGTFCVVTYTPNAEWFESSERVFPVLLDPSITTNDYVSNIEDTYVEQNSSVIHSSEQHLYITPNGSNKRNAIVRITKLPEIDNSMPIISASLSLTTQSASSDEIDLKASYIDSGLELHEYTYYATTIDTFTYVSHSMIGDGESSVVFDVSPHIYEMYADKQFDDEYGYDYHGDFIIGYENSSTTTYLPPFYSSEYTITSNRPVFKVRYGYTLPAGMLSGSVYSFRNGGSYSYMSVNGTNPTNNSNIYQVWSDGDIAATTQKFKLEYVQSTGGYLLRAMSSSSGTDKVVSINRSSMDLANNMNVILSTYSDSISQEWLIIPIDYDEFKIVPRANMSLALTSYGFNNGTNTGITSTSQGNIFVQTMTDDNSNQKWYIFDNNDNEVMTSQSSAPYETGYYYISNSFNGKYLHISNSMADCMRGQKSALGDSTVKWHIFNLGDGYCTIQRTDILHCYLAPSNNTNGSGVRVYNNQSESIPDICKWSLQLGSGGGYVLRNKGTGYYLTAADATSNPSSLLMSSLYSAGTDAYKRQNWRIVSEDYYVELGIAASFNDINIDVDETKSASINKSPSDASWASYTDFDYTVTSDDDYVTYDSTTHKFTGKIVGTAFVTAVHKTTGLSDSFTINVNNNAIIIVPGIMGTELIAGPNNTQYNPGEDLWSEELRDGNLDGLEKAERIISLRCDSNGNSINDVVVRSNKYGVDDTYKPLYDYLLQEYGNEYTVEFFAYDWRLSNAVSASSLNTFINTKGYDNVILVCHSMGGLVASGYLALGETQRNKVDKIITLGSPLLGTSVMPYLWGSEDINVIGLLNNIGLPEVALELIDVARLYYNIVDLFLSNFKSLYEMFPSEKYFDSSYADKSYLITSIVGGSELEITTYSETCARLESYLAYYKSNHIDSAENYHSSLYFGSSHVTELVNTYYIAGYNVSTIDIIEYNMWDWSIYDETLLGDSLVATWSATLGDRTSNRTFFAKNVDHIDLVQDTELIAFVSQLIDGSSSVTAYTNIYANIQ